MSQKTPASLDELWDAIPTGPAPVEELLARGHAANRRRRVRLGAAMAAAIVAGAFATTGVLSHPANHPGLAIPAAGTRLVGMGRVAVAVPTSWALNAATCNAPFTDTTYFAFPQQCIGPARPVSSVDITSRPSFETNTEPSGALKPAGSVAGHRVVADSVTCPVGLDESCWQAFGIPDLHAYFTVTIPTWVKGGAVTRINAIRNSLTVLPSKQAAVPFVTPGSSVAEVRAALESAGFTVVIHPRTCPVAGTCRSPMGTSPAAGLVVPAGSTVAIHVVGH